MVSSQKSKVWNPSNLAITSKQMKTMDHTDGVILMCHEVLYHSDLLNPWSLNQGTEKNMTATIRRMLVSLSKFD